MAKIVLVSPHVTETTWQLARALKAQQHDVVLLTSYGESVDDTSGIEFMAYFKKWSFLEAMRVIPGLFGMQAQILHLLLEEDSLNPAQALLAVFARSHPKCILTTSLLHIRRGLGRMNLTRYLIEESDIVTCPTVENLAELRGLSVRSRRQGRGILPPVLNLNQQQSLSAEEVVGERKITEVLAGEPYVVVPFHENGFDAKSEFFQRFLSIAKKYKVVLWGSQASWTLRARKQFAQWTESENLADRWVVTGSVSLPVLQDLLSHSEALILSGLPLTPVEITEYFLKAIQTHATMILDSAQTSVHGGLWQNGVNCWILHSGFIDTEIETLLEKKSLRIANATNAITQERQWLDHPLNELSRLYNRALEYREKNG
jgi:hypothetical protein